MQDENILESTFTQSIPMWDETEKVQTATKFTHTIKTDTKVPRLGVMLVGLGGNNGTTFTAGILANKKGTTWETKNGVQTPNFYGSFTQSATTHVGFKYAQKNNQ